MKENYIFQLNIICAGSTSLCKALNILGIPSLHYKVPGEDINREVFELDVIPENIKLNRRLFYPYDEEWRGFLDFNGLRHYKTLCKMYPDSKFIYTWREYDPWIKSALKLSRNLHREKYNEDMSEKQLSSVRQDREWYWQHNKESMLEFSKNNPNFLIMRICDGSNDGWEKLCNFLEMDIPNVDFPNVSSNNHVFSNPVDN